MNKLTSKEDVSNLLSASLSSIALGAAIETGLLQLLAEKPMDGHCVSQVLNIPGKRGHYWLQLLEELGILERGPQGYFPTPLTRTIILDPNRLERWKHIAMDQRENLAGVRNLALYISEPGSIWKAQGLPEPKGYVEKMNNSPDRARVFTRLLYNFYQDSRNACAEVLDMTGVERMLDVGGGPGGLSMALVRKYPQLTSTVVDLANVCITGREIVEENHLSDRIKFYAADFVTDELPQGFDLALHCDIGVYGEALFRKLWEALNPGGRIVVIFNFPPSEHAAPAPYLRWAFLDSLKDPDFGFPTAAQVRAQLVQAGFHLLPGEFSVPDGLVIQAKKAME